MGVHFNAGMIDPVIRRRRSSDQFGGLARGFSKARGGLDGVCVLKARATRTDAVSVVVVPGTVT